MGIPWLSSTEHIDTEVRAELLCDCCFYVEVRGFSCKILLDTQLRGEERTVFSSTSLGKLTRYTGVYN